MSSGKASTADEKWSEWRVGATARFQLDGFHDNSKMNSKVSEWKCVSILLNLQSITMKVKRCWRIVTGDETWVHCYQPKSKRLSMQWRHKDSPTNLSNSSCIVNNVWHSIFHPCCIRSISYVTIVLPFLYKLHIPFRIEFRIECIFQFFLIWKIWEKNDMNLAFIYWMILIFKSK